MPIVRYSACELAWHRWEEPAAAACGVVPVAAVVPVFPSIVHIPALCRETHAAVEVHYFVVLGYL